MSKHTSRTTQPVGRRSIQGLALVELVGVLAILAIISSALIPPVVRRMDRAAWIKESNDLSAISNALVLQIVRSNTVPNETNWAATVASWTQRPVSQISTNNRKYARLYFYDSGGWMTNTTFTQTNTGTGASIPLNARIAIVSTISKPLPYLNGSLATTNFNSLWNDLPYKTPSYLTAQGWTGNSYDLVIQRVTLDTVFHRLVLANRDPSTVAAFSINSTNSSSTITVTNNATGWSSYYLDGTVVGLWNSSTLTNRFVLSRDTSYTFDGGQWGPSPTGSGKDGGLTAQNFVNIAKVFITEPNTGHQGADTQGALSAFYSFMFAYTVWANKCPHFEYVGNANSAVDFQLLKMLGQNSSAGIIYNTTGSTGGGLLK
jgi:hypothetical protein